MKGIMSEVKTYRKSITEQLLSHEKKHQEQYKINLEPKDTKRNFQSNEFVNYG